MIFRKLLPNEIEVRVGGKIKNTDKGFLLLYKDARCDMKILDETVGPLFWKRKHEIIDGQLFCTVSIYNKEIGEWVDKQDVGIESFSDKEKGRASDAFKRACFNIGIGRELYTAPYIGANGYESWAKDNFWVSEISYTDSGSIDKLTIKRKGAGTNWREETFFTNGKSMQIKSGLDQKTVKATKDEIADFFEMAYDWGYTDADIKRILQNTINKSTTENLSKENLKTLIGALVPPI